MDYSVEFRVFFFQPHDGRAGKYNFQVGVLVVACAQRFAPIGLFEYLVDKKHFSSSLIEFSGKIGYAATLKIEIVHVDIQARAVCPEFLFGVLE